jgi:hypothetical protein
LSGQHIAIDGKCVRGSHDGIPILEAFEDLTDPRIRECVHQLNELLLTANCAIISGAESWASVVEWSEMKLDWLRQHLPFANRIASHNSFQHQPRQQIYGAKRNFNTRIPKDIATKKTTP